MNVRSLYHSLLGLAVYGCAALPVEEAISDEAGHPIAGAFVTIYQSTHVLLPAPHPVAGPDRCMIVRTDEKGRFHVPAWINVNPLVTRANGYGLSAFHPGYVRGESPLTLTRPASSDDYLSYLSRLLNDCTESPLSETLTQAIVDDALAVAKTPAERRKANAISNEAYGTRPLTVVSSADDAIALAMPSWEGQHDRSAFHAEVLNDGSWKVTGPVLRTQSACEDVAMIYDPHKDDLHWFMSIHAPSIQVAATEPSIVSLPYDQPNPCKKPQ